MFGRGKRVKVPAEDAKSDDEGQVMQSVALDSTEDGPAELAEQLVLDLDVARAPVEAGEDKLADQAGAFSGGNR